MKFAIIEDNIVKNVALADPGFAAEQGWVAVPEGEKVAPGWQYDGSTFAEVPLSVEEVAEQEEFDKAITGQISAKEALDAVAEFQQELLEDGGYIEWYSLCRARGEPGLCAFETAYGGADT